MKILLAALFLFATIASASPLIDEAGNYHATRPSRIEHDGSIVSVGSDAWLVDNAGWTYATQEQIDAYDAEQAEANAQVERDRIAALAARYGGMVFLLRTRLVQLGHDLPGDSKTILSDVMGRSAAGTLSDAQEVALGKLTDMFILLKGENLTDADINAIWVFIQ